MVLVVVVLTERLLLLLLPRSNSAASKRANLRLADLARESSPALIVDRFAALSVDTKNEKEEERTTLRHCQFAQALSLGFA